MRKLRVSYSFFSLFSRKITLCARKQCASPSVSISKRHGKGDRSGFWRGSVGFVQHVHRHINMYMYIYIYTVYMWE